MAQTRMYHWKHGWIPLDHAAAMAKAHGSEKGAAPGKLNPVARDHLPRRSHVIAGHSAGHFTILDKKTGKAARIPEGHALDLRTNGQTITGIDAEGKLQVTAPNLAADTILNLRGGSADNHLVTDHSGTRFSPERAALHDQIIGKIVDGHKTQKNPAFVMLGGGPASGKTKAADAAKRDFPDAIKIDPDEIKKMLPEYAQMTPDEAAAFVHEESSYLAKRAMDAALQSKAHIVLDAVGNSSSESVRHKIGTARAAGYSTHARYVTVPTEVAQTRAHARGVKSGRVVHPEVVAKLHSGVSDVFPQVMHDFDTAALYDNTTEWKQVLTKYHGSPEVIHDLEAWRGFIQKAKRA